jgi:hypothetical protein
MVVVNSSINSSIIILAISVSFVALTTGCGNETAQSQSQGPSSECPCNFDLEFWTNPNWVPFETGLFDRCDRNPRLIALRGTQSLKWKQIVPDENSQILNCRAALCFEDLATEDGGGGGFLPLGDSCGAFIECYSPLEPVRPPDTPCEVTFAPPPFGQDSILLYVDSHSTVDDATQEQCIDDIMRIADALNIPCN